MKKTLIAAVTIFLFAGMSSYAFSQVKIGVINAKKVVEGTKRGKLFSAKFEKFGKEKQNTRKAMIAEIKKLEKELMSPALNQAAKEKKAQERQNKQTALKRFEEDSQLEMRTMYQEEMVKLEEEIKPVIRQIGREKGLTLVLEISAAAYFDPAVDITDDIIKAMDSKTTGAGK